MMNDENVPLNVLHANLNKNALDSAKPNPGRSPLRASSKTPSKNPVKICVKDIVSTIQGHEVKRIPSSSKPLGSVANKLRGSPAGTVLTTTSELTARSDPTLLPSRVSLGSGNDDCISNFTASLEDNKLLFNA
jgi:hypothetical protein